MEYLVDSVDLGEAIVAQIVYLFLSILLVLVYVNVKRNILAVEELVLNLDFGVGFVDALLFLSAYVRYSQVLLQIRVLIRCRALKRPPRG